MYSSKLTRLAVLLLAALLALALLAGCEAKDEKSYLAAQELLAAGEYDAASAQFAELGDYEDSADMVLECAYLKAGALLAAGEYDTAAEQFASLGEYKDSADMVLECAYLKAGAALSAGEYDTASEQFASLGEYKDSADMVLECAYLKAGAALAAGEYDTAAEQFASLGEYKDSADMILECSYVKADNLYNSGEYYAAANIFLELGEYKDSHARCLGAWHRFQPGCLAGAAWNCIAAVKNDGTVLCTRPAEYKGIENWTDIVSLAFGSDYIVGLRADGTVVAAGNNKYGNCNVEDWTDIVMISVYSSAGFGTPYNTVGLRADGTVVAVGRNKYGQCDVAGFRDIVYIAAGNTTTVGIKADGTTAIAGGYYEYIDYVPLEWNSLTDIACGGWFYAALMSDGTAIAGGDGYLKQTEVSGSEWTNLVALSANPNGTVGLRADGTVVYTGNYNYSTISNIIGTPIMIDLQTEVTKMENIAGIFLNGTNVIIGIKSDGTLDILSGSTKGSLLYNGDIDTALTWTDLMVPER